MKSPTAARAPSRGETAFMIALPLAWAVLLLFHGAPEADDIYGSLRDEGTRFLAVHLGSLVFLGLMGAVLYLLLRDLPGTAARIGRLAIGPFVVFYVAGDAILGVATGVLIDHANDLPANERAGSADAIQALWDTFITGDLLLGVGAVAWVVAAIASAFAYRGAGAPVAVSILLALSAITALHPPPFGPLGLVCFAAAVGLLAHSRREGRRVEAPALGDSAYS